ncbi:MAG TPA: DUF922 domain-containing protein [Bacteroidia bacterium]|nr:DUF922 domain-containing protein [Bacteroidia bacterium]
MNRIRLVLSLRLLLLLLVALPTLSAAPTPQAAIDGEIRWTKDSRLGWEDFQAKPDRLSNMDALTESGITFSWSCDYRGFSVEAYAIFVPSGSWVKEPTPSLLLHEQGHFDITEIHARKLRKFFAEHPNPCRLGKSGIDNAAKAIIAANYQLQNEYDEATNHGESNRMQREWLTRIATELEALEPWAE